MINKLRHKIFVGVLLLATLLAASGSMILYQFLILNKSINALIEDNYKTIQACQSMLEALEREDSGILLLSLGQWTEGREIISRGDSLFQASFEIAKRNQTEPGEGQYLATLEKNYSIYKSKWERPIVGTERERNIEWYTQEINASFITTKNAVSDLMALNQDSMYGEALIIKERSYRAIMPGMVAIAAVILFALLFNFFLSTSLMAPLRKLINATKNFKTNSPTLATNLKTRDEFKELEEGIQGVIDKLRAFYEKSGK